MPTVQIEQLEQQSKALAEFVSEPEEFVRQLDLHFELYAQRAKRSGEVGRKVAILPRYGVQPPVMRQLLQEVSPLVEAQPQASLVLVDALWKRRRLEHRQLAAELLGQLPRVVFPNIATRIRRWAEENREEALIEVLANEASRRLREEDEVAFLDLCERLIEGRAVRLRATGLLALKAMVDEGRVDNLPAMLDLIIPLAQNPSSGLRPYLLRVMKALIARSPGEALYFLQQRLIESPEAGTRWLARQALKHFPPEEAERMREALEG